MQDDRIGEAVTEAWRGHWWDLEPGTVHITVAMAELINWTRLGLPRLLEQLDAEKHRGDEALAGFDRLYARYWGPIDTDL